MAYQIIASQDTDAVYPETELRPRITAVLDSAADVEALGGTEKWSPGSLAILAEAGFPTLLLSKSNGWVNGNTGGSGSGSGLPSGSKPNQYIVTDGDGNAKWEDKLAWDETINLLDEEWILPLHDSWGQYVDFTRTLHIDKDSPVLEEGDGFTVVLNGVTYENLYGWYREDNGKPKLTIFNYEAGELQCVTIFLEDSPKNGTRVQVQSDPEAETATLSYISRTVHHRLPVEFVPKAITPKQFFARNSILFSDANCDHPLTADELNDVMNQTNFIVVVDDAETYESRGCNALWVSWGDTYATVVVAGASGENIVPVKLYTAEYMG